MSIFSFFAGERVEFLLEVIYTCALDFPHFSKPISSTYIFFASQLFDMLSSDELVTRDTDSESVPGKWCKCGGVIPSMRMLSNIVLRCRRTRNVCYIDQIFKYKNHFVVSRLMKNEFFLSLILPVPCIYK